MKSILIVIGSLCFSVAAFSAVLPTRATPAKTAAQSNDQNAILRTSVSKVWNDLHELRVNRIKEWQKKSFRTQSEAFQGLKAATISREEITSLFAQRGISSYLDGPKRATDPGLLQKIVESENHKMRRVFIERSSALSKLPYGDVDAVNALLHN